MSIFVGIAHGVAKLVGVCAECGAHGPGVVAGIVGFETTGVENDDAVGGIDGFAAKDRSSRSLVSCVIY